MACRMSSSSSRFYASIISFVILTFCGCGCY